MAKRYTSYIHLHLSHILNIYPNIPENYILDKTSIIKSRKALKETLIYMEENQIIMNPHLYIRNCEGHSNHYVIAEVKNWNDFHDRIISKNWEAIDSAFYIRSWKKNRLAYIKYHNTLENELKNILEEGPIDYVCTIHPQTTDDRELLKKLKEEPAKKSHIEPDRLTRKFDWDYDTKQIFWWLSINYRMSLTQMARKLKVSRTTIKRKKEHIEEFTYIHYPTYIHSFQSYTGVLSSFNTEYPEYIKEILQNLSATCYIFGNRDKILCFINTTLPSHAIQVFEELEQKAIIEGLNTEVTVRSWNKIVDQFQLGRIPEKFFWMFKRKIEKKRIE